MTWRMKKKLSGLPTLWTYKFLISWQLGVNVNLNDPNELDVFLHFIGVDLWDLIVNESN